MSDIIVAFAVLWGKEIASTPRMDLFDSEELTGLFTAWAKEFEAGSKTETIRSFFEKKADLLRKRLLELTADTECAVSGNEYWVTMKVEGRHVAHVYAESVEEAKTKATEAYQDADYGPLEDIDMEHTIIEDADGNFVWEKD